MTDSLRRAFYRLVGTLHGATDPQRGGLVERMRDIEPGKVSILRVVSTGEEFAIMHLDDFDHIVTLAGLRRRDDATLV